jgi:hypothetical protein
MATTRRFTTAEATTTPTVVPSAPTVLSEAAFGGVKLLSTRLILSAGSSR